MQGTFLGPKFSNDEVETVLRKNKLVFKKVSDEEIFKLTAAEMKDQKTVGWFQGRMEFGSRALGNRSILADARSADMQKKLNLKIKFRESFRPFAPALLEEDVPIWFDMNQPSPYMLFLAQLHQNKKLEISVQQQSFSGIKKLDVIRSEIPAVTHVDCSSRIQSVNEKFNPKFHSLLTEFKKITGCSVAINTSFNVRGEPIACTPEDAIRCFLGTDLDLLVIENFVLFKKDQPQSDSNIYKDHFDLD